MIALFLQQERAISFRKVRLHYLPSSMEDTSGLQRRQHCQGKLAVLVSLLCMTCKKVFQSFILSIHNPSSLHVLLVTLLKTQQLSIKLQMLCCGLDTGQVNHDFIKTCSFLSRYRNWHSGHLISCSAHPHKMILN